MKDFNFEIHSSKIHIDLSGGIIADIADPFVALFKSLIVGKINKAVNNSIPDVIKSKINAKLMSTEGLAPLTENLMADFTFSSLPIITDSTLAMFLNATIYDSKLGYRIPMESVSDVQIQTTS